MPHPCCAASQSGDNLSHEGRRGRPKQSAAANPLRKNSIPGEKLLRCLGRLRWNGDALLLAHEKNSRTDRRVSSDEFQLSVVADGVL